MADLLFDFNIKEMTEIFEEDNQLKAQLQKKHLYIADITISEKNPERLDMLNKLAYSLLSEYDFISDRQIEDLWYLQFKVEDITRILKSAEIIDFSLYRQIMFSFKYSTIKHFFKENMTKFLPSLDAEVINSNEKMQIFQMAFMQEYDRFAQIIDNMYEIVDIDTIGNDYLNYLTQILGYEKGDDALLDNNAFRELAKNIIEVYRIKGTNYSYELFFNFLGFDVILNEFWFDKRYYDEGISVNPYTGSNDPASFEFYLTTEKPTESMPKGMTKPITVCDDELTDIRSPLWFTKKISLGSSVTKLLGLDENDKPEEGFDYTYFKTNIIQYDIRRIRSKETDKDTLSEEDEAIIQKYLDFLTPIFIMKQVLVTINPFEDSGDNLNIIDQSFFNYKTQTYENMFKTKGGWFISDDWIRQDLATNDSRPPLTLKDETNVEDNINAEEKREYFLFIKTYDHFAESQNETKDDLKNIVDLDNTDGSEFSTGNLFKVQVVKNNELKYRDTINNSDDQLISVLDLNYGSSYVWLNFTQNLRPIDGSWEYMDIQKIVDYKEDLFNRMQRTENLNILNRDFSDWDNFDITRHIPSFKDSILERDKLNGFEIKELNELQTLTSNNSDGAAHCPWWFYEKLSFLIENVFIGFGFTKCNNDDTFATMYLDRNGMVVIKAAPSLDELLDEIILKPVSYGKTNVSINSNKELHCIPETEDALLNTNIYSYSKLGYIYNTNVNNISLTNFVIERKLGYVYNPVIKVLHIS